MRTIRVFKRFRTYAEYLESTKDAVPGKKLFQREETKFFLDLVRERPNEDTLPRRTREQNEANKKIYHVYANKKMVENAEFKKSINLRRILHESAISNLPNKQMKEFARKPDVRPFPGAREPPTWTPPHRKFKN